jgi:peptide deformylase
MAILDILAYPDPRLYQVAQPVKIVDARVTKLIVDMADTMYAAPGIGLAAIQINEPLQIITIDISEDKSQLLTFINPEIVRKEGQATNEEGCLSVPGIYDKVERAESVTVTALDHAGIHFTINASGLLAVCIQHEMDHLLGRVFVDYLSPLKRQRIKSKMKKRERLRA